MGREGGAECAGTCCVRLSGASSPHTAALWGEGCLLANSHPREAGNLPGVIHAPSVHCGLLLGREAHWRGGISPGLSGIRDL